MKPKAIDLTLGTAAALLVLLSLADMLLAATAEQIRMSCSYGRTHVFSAQSIANQDTARLRGWMIFLACEAPPETR